MFMQNMREYAKTVLDGRPLAKASIKGFPALYKIHGYVNFYAVRGGTLIVAEIYNLPEKMDGKKTSGVFGFHIHTGTSCSKGTKEEPFPFTEGHYNPQRKPHPQHAGDMPVLFSNNGYAYLAFLSSRFAPSDVIGRTVVIHSHADDFHSQPAGDSGTKIACGEIRKAT